MVSTVLHTALHHGNWHRVEVGYGGKWVFGFMMLSCSSPESQGACWFPSRRGAPERCKEGCQGHQGQVCGLLIQPSKLQIQ